MKNSRKYNKSYRKRTTRKNKTNQRKYKSYTRRVRGGIGKVPPHQYLFFDKDNFPISQSQLNTLLKIAAMEPGFSPDDIRTTLKRDEISQNRSSSIIYLVDPALSNMFGYISGYTYYDEDKDKEALTISFVELRRSVRRLGLCVPMLDTYIKNVLANNPNIEFARLFNIGGEYSCRCYKKAFEMNGFTLKRDINCFSEDREELMVFDKN